MQGSSPTRANPFEFATSDIGAVLNFDRADDPTSRKIQGAALDQTATCQALAFE